LGEARQKSVYAGMECSFFLRREWLSGPVGHQYKSIEYGHAAMSSLMLSDWHGQDIISRTESGSGSPRAQAGNHDDASGTEIDAVRNP